MTNQQKNILFWLGAVLGAVLVIFLLVLTRQQLNTATTSNTVTFSGEGKVFAKPDIARLNFTILTQATTSKLAQDANSAKSKQVTDVLKKNGIEEKDIKTTGYNIYPQQTYPQYDSPRITGYQVSENFQITIRDLESANKVLDGVVGAGVNQVDQLIFEIENPEDLKEQARKQAIDDAKDKAKDLKSEIGISLGKIVNFQENLGGGIYYAREMSYDGGYGGGGPSLPVGENEVIVNVSITYQIK